MDKVKILDSTLQEAADILADALANSEPFVAYQQANKKLTADLQAMQLLQDYSGLQQRLRSPSPEQQKTKTDLEKLRELQVEIDVNETIQNFGAAQQAAIVFLRAVNQEISLLIGVDFASLIPQSGTC